jgi:hypothetical protein
MQAASSFPRPRAHLRRERRERQQHRPHERVAQAPLVRKRAGGDAGAQVAAAAVLQEQVRVRCIVQSAPQLDDVRRGGGGAAVQLDFQLHLV